ncbi:MAG: nucleotidyltransferase family protein [Candidatus Woesearchaeota archaeon]
MLTREEIIKELNKNAEKIRSLGVNKLSLFGSYAKENQHAGSDIDFLVEFKQGRGLFDDYVQLQELLEELFGEQVDLVKKHLLREELRENILSGKQYEAKI